MSRHPRSGQPRAALVAAGFLLLLGLGALAGGLCLVVRPDGSLMGFSTALLAGSPFRDFLLPGAILGGLFGIGSFVALAAIALREPWAPFAAFVIGCGQMIWILVQLAIIRELSFLHPAMFGIGLVIAVAAALWGWPTVAAWRQGHRPRPRPNVQSR
jgi:hypothetical protein